MLLRDERVLNMTKLAMLAAIAIICGYIEALFPFSFGIPGIKLGLANVVSIFALYARGPREAAAVSLIRIIVVGLLFGNLYGILYSLAGGLLSIACMITVYRLRFIGVIGCSIVGGITHNLGQLLVAAFVVKQLQIFGYAPILLLGGTICGALIGLLCQLLLARLAIWNRNKIVHQNREGNI